MPPVKAGKVEARYQAHPRGIQFCARCSLFQPVPAAARVRKGRRGYLAPRVVAVFRVERRQDARAGEERAGRPPCGYPGREIIAVRASYGFLEPKENGRPRPETARVRLGFKQGQA